MADLLTVQYKQTGKSSNLNDMGMRAMQARAYEARDAQYLLLKAPPASGKSRALMFLGLDKLQAISLEGFSRIIIHLIIDPGDARFFVMGAGVGPPCRASVRSRVL